MKKVLMTLICYLICLDAEANLRPHYSEANLAEMGTRRLLVGRDINL